MTETIRTCPFCNVPLTLEQLAYDSEIRVLGMAFADDELEWVYYFFQHEAEDCGSSFLVRVDQFRTLIDERLPTEKLTGRDCCEQHCVTLADLSECKQECYFAPFRRFLQRMVAWKGTTRSNPLQQSRKLV